MVRVNIVSSSYSWAYGCRAHKTTCVCLQVSQWAWLQRIFGTWWTMFCDANPSRWYIPVKRRTEMYHCCLVVVTRLDVARGWGRGSDWQLVSWLSAQNSWPPESLLVRHTYSHVVSCSRTISHKGQITPLIRWDGSVNTEENDNHSNLLSKFQMHEERFKRCHGNWFPVSNDWRNQHKERFQKRMLLS